MQLIPLSKPVQRLLSISSNKARIVLLLIPLLCVTWYFNFPVSERIKMPFYTVPIAKPLSESWMQLYTLLASIVLFISVKKGVKFPPVNV